MFFQIVNFDDFALSPRPSVRFLVVEDVHRMNRISSLVVIDAELVCGVV